MCVCAFTESIKFATWLEAKAHPFVGLGDEAEDREAEKSGWLGSQNAKELGGLKQLRIWVIQKETRYVLYKLHSSATLQVSMCKQWAREAFLTQISSIAIGINAEKLQLCDFKQKVEQSLTLFFAS